MNLYCSYKINQTDYPNCINCKVSGDREHYFTVNLKSLKNIRIEEIQTKKTLLGSREYESSIRNKFMKYVLKFVMKTKKKTTFKELPLLNFCIVMFHFLKYCYN